MYRSSKRCRSLPNFGLVTTKICSRFFDSVSPRLMSTLLWRSVSGNEYPMMKTCFAPLRTSKARFQIAVMMELLSANFVNTGGIISTSVLSDRPHPPHTSADFPRNQSVAVSFSSSGSTRLHSRQNFQLRDPCSFRRVCGYQFVFPQSLGLGNE